MRSQRIHFNRVKFGLEPHTFATFNDTGNAGLPYYAFSLALDCLHFDFVIINQRSDDYLPRYIRLHDLEQVTAIDHSGWHATNLHFGGVAIMSDADR